MTGCWLEDAQEGLGRPTKTALQLQGVVFQAPASPLAAAQRVLACTGPRPERQGSKARSFIYSGCCWGLGISCLGEEGKKKQVSLSFSSWGLLRKIALSSAVVHTLASAIGLVSVYSMCTCYVCTCIFLSVYAHKCALALCARVFGVRLGGGERYTVKLLKFYSFIYRLTRKNRWRSTKGEPLSTGYSMAITYLLASVTIPYAVQREIKWCIITNCVIFAIQTQILT